MGTLFALGIFLGIAYEVCAITDVLLNGDHDEDEYVGAILMYAITTVVGLLNKDYVWYFLPIILLGVVRMYVKSNAWFVLDSCICITLMVLCLIKYYYV